MDEAAFRAAEQHMWASVGVDGVTERMLALGRTGAAARVQEVGDGPPIVFVHGASNSGVSWAHLVAGLCQDHRCVVLDRPGCGLSPKLSKPFADVDAFATFSDALVADVLDALDLDRAAVVATSYGGYPAIRGAAAHPGRIQHLVLLGWFVGAPSKPMPFIMRAGSSPALGRLMTAMPANERMVRSMFKRIGLRQALERGRVSDEMVASFTSMLRNTDTMRNEIEAGPRFIRLRGYDDAVVLTPSVYAAVAAPTLLLWGEDDPFGGETQARQVARSFPSATLEMVPGEHAVWIDEPTAIAERVRAFLA